MLSTGLDLNAPMARRKQVLCIGSVVFKALLLADWYISAPYSSFDRIRALCN